MEIPCKQCPVVPICRHKHFIDMRIGCITLDDFLMTTNRERIIDYGERVAEIFHFMKPTKWGYLVEHGREAIVDMRHNSNNNYIKKSNR